MAALPADVPTPRLLWSYDEEGWIALVFEDIEGQHPVIPWRPTELDSVLAALTRLSTLLTPSPFPTGSTNLAREEFRTNLCGWQRLLEEEPSRLSGLDAWSRRHIDTLANLEARATDAVHGNTLLHFDIRADNILMTPEQVWFVDWPHACVGAAWVDLVFFAPSVTMQGGPTPEYLCSRDPGYQRTDPDAITAAIAAVAGFFIHRSLQPPPPGLPTVRAFQAAQGTVARAWLAERTGLP